VPGPAGAVLLFVLLPDPVLLSSPLFPWSLVKEAVAAADGAAIGPSLCRAANGGPSEESSEEMDPGRF
jgi:hypothetical protein